MIDYNEYATHPENSNDHIDIGKIRWIQKRLGSGKYTKQPQTLLDDLNEIIAKIRHEESIHREKTGISSGKCCRSSRSFRHELSVVAELIEEYTENQGQIFLNQEDIQYYIQGILNGLKYSIGNSGKNKPGNPQNIDIYSIDLELKREMEELGDSTPGLIKRYLVEMTVDDDLPVIVNCPSGTIKIIGSDQNIVKATLVAKITAGSKNLEKELSELISLTGSNHNDGYYISANLPRISDPNVNISQSVMLVEVPSNNPFVCNSYFTDLTISDLNAQLKVSSANSNIVIEDVNAEVNLTNSMGDVILRRVAGNLKLNNANGSIEINNCIGQMNIENIFSDIRLSETSGDVNIRNSGLIKINDHSGQLSMNNNYGEIDIRNVDGELVVHNSYKPITISRATGSIKLQNDHASIKVKHINGLLSVQNRQGNIFGEDLSGPIELENRGGTISIIIDEEFSGVSSVNASNGTINITLIGEPDIEIMAHTIDGTISSAFPISVTNVRGSESAELRFGSGGSILDVSGTNTSIIINARR